MTANAVLTSDMRIGTSTNDGPRTGATARRRHGASIGSLAVHAGRLGTGLGWHGSIATHWTKSTRGSGVELVDVAEVSRTAGRR